MKSAEELKENLLGRLFFAFPTGLPGVALLLVRMVLGVAILLYGELCFGRSQSTQATGLLGVPAVIAGGLLLAGFLTPIVATLTSGGVIGIAASLLPTCVPGIFESRILLAFTLTLLFTAIALGPGGFSIDARIFGRRRIIIPPTWFEPRD